MARQVELLTLDLRYENYRMKNPGLEARVLVSIAQRGIEEPLEGVDTKEGSILLNGFKRYRCARKLRMGMVPYLSLGDDEVLGIMGLLRTANDRTLSILEQARFIDDLKMLYQMSVSEIAQELSRSKAWVSMRLGLIGEMSDLVREKIFNGVFPVYSYMYTIRQFMRMNGVTREDIGEFVAALAGKKLSVRQIEQLAYGYFRGPESFREEIRKGHIALPLKMMKQVPEHQQGCSDFERSLLRDLELLQQYLQRVMGKSESPQLKTPSFYALAQLLTAGILSKQTAFYESMGKLHDRSRQA